MIVKDARNLLPDCLASVENLLQPEDEWIFVDTGSQDGTQTYLQDFCATKPHAQLISMDWEDHFAQARNRSLEAAQGDWILILDADERVQREGLRELQALRSQLDTSSLDGYCFLRENLDLQGRVDNWDLLIRLLKNQPELSFVGRIHERPRLLNRELRIQSLPQIRIAHQADSPEQEQQKEAYYLHLLQRARQEEPSPFLDFHWAILRPIQAGEPPVKRLKWVKEALEQSLHPPSPLPHETWAPAPLEACIFEIQLLLIESGQSEAMLNWFKGLDPQYLYAEAWGHYALASLEHSRPEEAYRAFFQCLDPDFSACAPQQGWQSWRALSFLAPLFEQQGDFPASAALALLAHLADPPEDFATSLQTQLKRIAQRSGEALHTQLQKLNWAQVEAFKQRDMQAVFALGCLLLPLVLNSQVLRNTLIAAQRLNASYFTKLLGAIGSLLWPNEDIYRHALQLSSSTHTAPSPLANLLLYAFFPQQNAPGLTLLWGGAGQAPALPHVRELRVAPHQETDQQAKEWPEKLDWTELKGDWVVQLQCHSTLPPGIVHLITAITQIPATRCDAFILQRPGLDLRIASRLLGQCAPAIESWHPVLLEAPHPAGPLKWFRQPQGPFARSTSAQDLK